MAARNDETSGNAALEITCTCKVPRHRVWKAWSQADQLKHWWGPKGCSIDVARFEFRLGGFFHYAMKFADAPENPSSNFCPLEIENSVVFTERDGATTVALRAEPFGEVAEELCSSGSLEQGSGGTLEQLADCLANT